MTLHVQFHHEPNGDGWRLSLKQTWDDAVQPDGRRPLLIVPGYGMNSFIFGYHPSGPSLEAYLAGRGFEVWSADLRGQRLAIRDGGRKTYGMADIALVDLPAAVAGVLRRTRTGAERVDLIGCSLGGTYVYLYAALRPEAPLGALVGMGAPWRWTEVHPLVRIVMGSPWLAGRLRIGGAPRLARCALPLLLKAPSLLHIYMHPEIVDTRDIAELTKTVDNPNPRLNEEIAWWIKRRDLFVEGVNATEALAGARLPLLCLYANADGIVPPSAALSAYNLIGSPPDHKTALEVGTADTPFAHADMFISHPAPDWVFAPLADWLEARTVESRSARIPPVTAAPLAGRKKS